MTDPCERKGTVMAGIAELSYTKTAPKMGTIELLVPHGTKLKEIAKLRELVFNDLIAKLPRACGNCHSGDNFVIRERLDPVIRVDIQTLRVVK
jgi:hypothetical protein